MKPVYSDEVILSEDTVVHKKNSRLFLAVLNSKSISPLYSSIKQGEGMDGYKERR